MEEIAFNIQTGRKFNFGKHKGEFILEIIHKQPWYIEWLLKKVGWFKLNEEEASYYIQTKRDWIDAANNVFFAFPKGVGSAKEIYKVVESYKKGEIKKSRNEVSIAKPSHDYDDLEYIKHINYVEEYNNIDDGNPYNIV